MKCISFYKFHEIHCYNLRAGTFVATGGNLIGRVAVGTRVRGYSPSPPVAFLRGGDHDWTPQPLPSLSHYRSGTLRGFLGDPPPSVKKAQEEEEEEFSTSLGSQYPSIPFSETQI